MNILRGKGIIIKIKGVFKIIKMKKTKHGKFFLMIFLITVIFLFSISLSTYAQQGSPLVPLSASIIAKSSFPSVLMLVMEDSSGQPLSLGSGFFVREGIVATNFHVIEGAVGGYTKIVGQELKYDIAGVVGIDNKRDLVLLTIKGAKAPSLSLGDSQQVAVGDEVYAIGNPQGLEGTFSQGIVSSIRQVGSETIFQITAPISPGSSGGPVLNTQGNVIGVTVATFKDGQNLNFAIPSYYLASLLRQIKPVTPLSAVTKPKQDKSIIDEMGDKSTGGVTAGQFTWCDNFFVLSGYYSFSLRNQLRESITNVRCLVIFYDDSDNPIDVDVIFYGESQFSKDNIIPAGLAKRITSRVDGSVQKLSSKVEGLKTLSTNVEFRILDFTIVD